MIRVVYFGTSEESLPAFEALHADAQTTICAVVTQPPRPIGRKRTLAKSALHERAEALNVPVLTPEKAQECVENLRLYNVDVNVVVSYGQILPEDLINDPEYGTLNVHPSLLPRHRGASPVPAAIIAGDEDTGVSIFRMDAKMDHGPLLYQSDAIPVGNKDAGQLLNELMSHAANVLPDLLRSYTAGSVTLEPQDHDKATFCRLLSRDDARIDWGKGANYVERMIRAYDPWPGAWTEIEHREGVWQRVKILSASVAEDSELPDGQICAKDNQTYCGKLRIETLQIAGKSPVDGEAFARTQPEFCKAVR